MTKQLASEIAVKMTVERFQKNENLKQEISFKVRDSYVKNLNHKIVDIWLNENNLSPFLKMAGYINLVGNGFDHESFKVDVPSKNGYTVVYEPTPEEAKEWRISINRYEKEKSDVRQLRREIETILYNLRTFQKIQTEFPEAAVYLPQATSSSLSICVDDIRKKLK